jgi:hypothetical protein
MQLVRFGVSAAYRSARRLALQSKEGDTKPTPDDDGDNDYDDDEEQTNRLIEEEEDRKLEEAYEEHLRLADEY